MKTYHLGSFIPVAIILALGLWLGTASVATAAPFTSHLDPLIGELQARSAALTGTTNKIEIKQKKAIDKILASFEKDSLSFLTDLKLAAKAAKALAKAFPEEFLPAPQPLVVNPKGVALTNLDEIIQAIVDAFDGDLATIADTAQALVNAAPDNPCKDKAQAALDEVAEQLALLPTAPDNATAFKILSNAAKNALKGATLAETIDECKSSSGGGGGSGNWYDWKLSYTVNGTKISFYENGQTSGPDLVGITYFNSGTLQVLAYKQGGSPYLYFACNIGNPGGGTHSIVSGTYSDGVNSYTITSGTINITKWPSSFAQFDDLFGKATFSFTATGTAGTVNGTSGSFSTWIYPPF
jgi:hypothetical protein